MSGKGSVPAVESRVMSDLQHPAIGPDGADPASPDPALLRLRTGLRVEVLEDEALALDPLEGVVHRLEGPAAGIVAALVAGRVPALADEQDHLVLDALREARIVTVADPSADIGD